MSLNQGAHIYVSDDPNDANDWTNAWEYINEHEQFNELRQEEYWIAAAFVYTTSADKHAATPNIGAHMHELPNAHETTKCAQIPVKQQEQSGPCWSFSGNRGVRSVAGQNLVLGALVTKEEPREVARAPEELFYIEPPDINEELQHAKEFRAESRPNLFSAPIETVSQEVRDFQDPQEAIRQIDFLMSAASSCRAQERPRFEAFEKFSKLQIGAYEAAIQALS